VEKNTRFEAKIGKCSVGGRREFLYKNNPFQDQSITRLLLSQETSSEGLTLITSKTWLEEKDTIFFFSYTINSSERQGYVPGPCRRLDMQVQTASD
jgi:hypothetical protein